MSQCNEVLTNERRAKLSINGKLTIESLREREEEGGREGERKRERERERERERD